MTDSIVLPKTSDIVFVDTLRVSADLGLDCWAKKREQPVELTIYLHMNGSYLTTAGESDNVLDSVNYGSLTKIIMKLMKDRAGTGFAGPDALIAAVAEQTFELAGDAAAYVRVILNAPKMLLIASGYSVDVTTIRGPPHSVVSKQVLIKDMIFPVIIGLNPTERKRKQRVVVNIIFYEDLYGQSSPDYQEIVQKLSKEIEVSSYLTLEKFVLQIVQSACLASEKSTAVTVKAQKPSALTFAQSSGIEITRPRAVFLKD